jgi:hypothetical protein
MMNKKSHFAVFISTLFLIIIGWGGLAVLVTNTMPTIGPRWLFFFLVTLALSGTSLPVIYFLNLRFPAMPPVKAGIIIREAIWVGIYGDLMAWLQLGRILTPSLMGFVGIGFILLEILLRINERSQWKPDDEIGD